MSFSRKLLSFSFLALVSIYSSSSFAVDCSSAVTDPDGDGWGWENNRSCSIPTGHPTCSSNAVINGAWGFENGKSCRVASGSTSSAGTSGRPSCTSAAINNGDGWGWENNQSCRYSSGSSSQGTIQNDAQASTPSCSSAAVNNGDGWGWENNQSCIYRGGTATQAVSVRTETATTTNANGVAQCSANAEDTGNGWGYQFGESCQWGDVQPNNGNNNIQAAPPPVAVSAVGYQNGTPICLTDASDGNGDGFGYENDRSCLIVAGTTATAANPLLNTRWCQPWAEIAYDDYVLQNNTWNFSDVYSDNWSQCIELTGNRGNYVAKWDYNWLARNEGNEYSVKSYPQVFYGRKTSNSQSGTVSKLGLPVMVNNIPDYKVRYKYSETGNAERNVALESFFHTSCEAEEWNKHFEMMIWVGKPFIKTPGLKVTEATIDGKEWLVYTNPKLSWGYVAFVEKESSTEGWLSWKDFVDWTRFQGPQYGVWSVGNTCMGAIEIGTETFWGNGTFTLHEFKVTR